MVNMYDLKYKKNFSIRLTIIEKSKQHFLFKCCIFQNKQVK